MSMCDHIYDPALPAELMGRPLAEGETLLAVDLNIRDNPFVDLDDVTKVRQENGLIREIGKSLRDYNAFDTGVFLSSSGLFEALEESQRRGDFTLSGGMRVLAARDKARAADIGGRLWIDVDDPACLPKAADVLERIEAASFPNNPRT
jgi:1L-myo-inositol 1-phosphate cytidylyltransferase